MEPADLTVRILEQIRDEQRSTREELRGTREELREMARAHAARFEVIETTLRDLAQQLVILGRGVKTAIEDRRAYLDKWEDHERRLAALEKKVG
jgi:hypothetical protein